MPLDDLPLAPAPEPAADGWMPGQSECRQSGCDAPRDRFNQRCKKHQPKRAAAPVDWDAVRQNQAKGRSRR